MLRLTGGYPVKSVQLGLRERGKGEGKGEREKGKGKGKGYRVLISD